MGFLGNLGKLIVGQPISQSSPSSTQQGGSGVIDERGHKIIPDIDVKNLRSQINGDKLIVKAWIVNNSADQVIRIDTSYLLKQKRQHNQELSPKNSREITLYDGPAPRNENERSAQITYRLTHNGDVFMENYRIDYGLESDGKRIVEELHDDGPVRDI